MRRIVVHRGESDDSNGMRGTPRRCGLARKSSSSNCGELLRITGAVGLRAPSESKYSSSALTSTAEKSLRPQTLLGATSCGLPSAPVVAISWHCSWRAPEAQLFAAQSGAHTGAITKASTVKKASTAAFAGRGRTGIEGFIPRSALWRSCSRAFPSRLMAMARHSAKRFAPSIGGAIMFAKKPASHAFW
jgi:hypothetical protein